MAKYYGNKHVAFELTQRIGGGGEGDIFEIQGHPDKLAKLYTKISSAHERQEMHNKLKAMLDMNISSTSGTHIVIAWPCDVLFDTNGDFCGYVMPRIRKSPIYCAYFPSERKRLFGEYNWDIAPKLAYNLASMVAYCHRTGIVLGDLNSDNFLVDSKGYVSLIDTDSYNIVYQGKTYKCKAGVGDMLAPELQGKDLSKSTSHFSKDTDNFSLAIHLYQILMNGVHPFIIPTTVNGSSASNPIVTNIASGRSVFTKGVQHNIDMPDLNMLPDYILRLFQRVFDYTAFTAMQPTTIQRRPSADEWVSALSRLVKDTKRTCKNDVHHVYPASYHGNCPWCEVEKRQKPFLPKLQPPKQISVPQPNHVAPPQAVPASTKATPASNKNRSIYPLIIITAMLGSFTAGACTVSFADFVSELLGCVLPHWAAMLALLIGVAISTCVIASVFGERYQKASTAWPWLFTSLLGPLLVLVITYGFVLCLYAFVPIAVLVGICSALANM